MQNEIYDEKNGLTYMLCGDYYLPELALKDIEPTYGKYGMLRKRLRDKTRKVLQIVEVEGYEDGRIQTKVLYEFKEEGMKNGKIQGCLMKKNEITNKEKLLAAGYHTI